MSYRTSILCNFEFRRFGMEIVVDWNVLKCLGFECVKLNVMCNSIEFSGNLLKLCRIFSYRMFRDSISHISFNIRICVVGNV